MDRREALDVLGLSHDATDEEVAVAYRTLARQAHPDRGGSDEVFQRLGEARAALLSSGNGVLVPLDQLRDLVKIMTGDAEQSAKRVELREEFQVVVRQAIKVRTTRLSRQQRQFGLITFFTALVGAASQMMRLVPNTNNELIAAFGVMLLVLAGFLGIMIAFLAYSKSQIEADITEAAEALEDKQVLVDVMREILRQAHVPTAWTASQWHEAVEQWVQDSPHHKRMPDRRGSVVDYARRMGSFEFSRMVTAKAKELQVIAQHESWNGNRLRVTYDFNRPQP